MGSDRLTVRHNRQAWEGCVTEPPTGCGLYAVLEAGDGAGERLTAALAAVEAAAVLIAPPAGERLDAAMAKPLVEQAKAAGVACLLMEDARLARTLGAEGVHLQVNDDAPGAYRAARELLGKGALVGADAGISRHAAMVLADAGADYVGFGAPPHLKDLDKARARREELIAWWAPIFEVPCVAFDVESGEAASGLAAAGADFVAVTLEAGLPAATVRERLAGIAQAIREAGATS
jgi:thiamine-phosphate pyrophosphorylase